MNPRSNNPRNAGVGQPVAVALDMGGTSLKAAVVDAGARVPFRTEIPARPSRPPESIEADLVELHRRCEVCIAESAAGSSDRQTPVRVGVALPGLRTADGTGIARADHLPTLSGYPLIANLRRRIGPALVVDADSRLSALADYHFGAGRGAARLAVAAVGTGIGVGVLIDGQLLDVTGLGQIAVSVPAAGPATPEAAVLEQIASAAALDRAVRAAVNAPLDHDQIRFALKRAIESGRGEVFSAIRRWADSFAAGIQAWQREYELDRVTITGGLTRYGEPVLRMTRAAVRERFTHGPPPDILFSPLGPDAALIGAGLAALGVLRAGRAGQRDQA